MARSAKAGTELSLEIAGVTVVPHYVSGEIPNYRDEEKFLSKFNPGALIRIFVSKLTKRRVLILKFCLMGKPGRS